METSKAILTFNYRTGEINEYDPAGAFLQTVTYTGNNILKRAYKEFHSLWREWFSGDSTERYNPVSLQRYFCINQEIKK